jgi:hypothetical protein
MLICILQVRLPSAVVVAVVVFSVAVLLTSPCSQQSIGHEIPWMCKQAHVT